MSRFVLAFVLVLATPVAAGPAIWSKASLTEAPTYFPAGATTMVVAVGGNARPAAATLIEALQASDQLELVTDGRALGSIDELSDAQIVKRAFAQRIDRLAIVRVFPAADSLKAVVTIYGGEGQVTSGFTITPGKLLAANPTPESAEDGVSRNELHSVLGTVDGASTGESGEVTFERSQVVGVTAYGILAFDQVTFFKDGRTISDTPSFYEAVGMKAKADEFREQQGEHRKWSRRGGLMAGAGLLGMCTFGTWALLRAVSTDYDSKTGDPIDGPSATFPLLLTGGSLVLMIVGYSAIASNPAPANLSGDEGIALAKEYNKKRRGGAATSKLRFAPSASPSGAGFIVGGQF